MCTARAPEPASLPGRDVNPPVRARQRLPRSPPTANRRPPTAGHRAPGTRSLTRPCISAAVPCCSRGRPLPIVYTRSKKSNRQIGFDDFIACAIRVRALSAAFRDRDAAQQGTATLQYDDFMRMVMRL